MDKLVGAIQSTNPQNENELKQLRGLLQKEEAILVKNLPVLDDVLNVLDPVQHSLGYAFILSVRILTPKLDGNRFLAVAQRFLVNASNNQIRLVGGRYSAVAHKYTQLCIESGQPMKAIKTLRLAIVKLRSNSESLTGIHADLIQCCLISKNYSAALPTLDEEIFEVNNDQTGVTPRDFLLYYYYGGMIYTGLKEYKKALNFFRTAVTSPAIVMSAIMAESYKKYILISLLVHGKVLPLPRFTSSVMQRHHKSSFPHYHEIANAYSTNSTDELHKVAQTHLEAFNKDHNFGLIKQVIQSLYRRNIQRYTQTYITFSLQDIAQGAKIESVQAAEHLLLKMIEKGEIFATINQQNGMVSFHEDPEAFDTTNTLNHINTQIQSAIDLSKRVKATDESISSSIDYIRKTTGGHERGGRGGGWGEYEEMNEGADKIPMGAGPGRLM